ncbi:MAG: serine hydrolase, partial [Gemmatimonadota bacterium]|nr:serine hydrolase [Gemmatimonadota bacterium]
GLLPIERRATVFDLITARSGIYHPASNAGDNSADAPPRGSQEPGSYFLYNNWDFNAAGAAFELMTGRAIYDALQSDLAEPLEMQDFDRDRQRKSGDAERSRNMAYHMWLSTRDMARIGYLMLRDGSWRGEPVIPAEWAARIRSVVTPHDEMNPEDLRGGEFGYGIMWWIWDAPDIPRALRGAYTARGAYGQYITVIPALDMVVAHKTVPRDRTGWSDYRGILTRLIDARCEGSCP